MMKYVKARKIMMLCVAGIAALTVAACAGKDKDGVNVIITEEKSKRIQSYGKNHAGCRKHCKKRC